MKLEKPNENIWLNDYLGEWTKNIDELQKTYSENEYFPHIVIENFSKENIAREITNKFPKISDNWVKFYNPI